MNVEEKERLIKKNMLSIENKVRHAFNQGYEMGVKELKAYKEQRTGQWIERCDEIGKWYECDQCHTDWGGPVNYCPNCGCKMGVEE